MLTRTNLTFNIGNPPIGSDVIALGAPEGLEFTLTKGVISSFRDKGSIIQTDAAINPGCSHKKYLRKCKTSTIFLVAPFGAENNIIYYIKKDKTTYLRP